MEGSDDDGPVCPVCSGDAEALDTPGWFMCRFCGSEFKKIYPDGIHCG